MKVGTLVRLRMDTAQRIEQGIVAGHGVGIVIACGVKSHNIRLVCFPKLGVTSWRTAHLLERVK